MNKIFAVLILALIASCSDSPKQSGDALTDSDTVTSRDPLKQKSIDSLMAIGNRPESEEMPPTQAEERKRLAGTYDNILVIDTVIASGNERLQLHVKHYCLKDSSLIIPKRYDDESAKPADFVTHPFVSDMVLINGKDTVLNKQFTAKDFYPFFNDPFVGNLKKYGSLLEPRVSHRSDNNNNIIITYSLSIPTTDLGIPVELNISKNGSYKIKAGY